MLEKEVKNPIEDEEKMEEKELEKAELTEEQIALLQTETLTKLKTGLSALSRTNDNTSYAYVSLKANELEMTGLYGCLSRFIHIRFLNLSKNKITDISGISSMTSLCEIDLSENQIQNLSELIENSAIFYRLQVLNISSNIIEHFEGKGFSFLEKLNLSNNKLTTLNCEGMKSLKTLEIRKNELSKIENIQFCENLEKIYGAQNKFENLDELRTLLQLEIIHMRENKITEILTVDRMDEWFPRLTYLNLRQNYISNQKNIIKVICFQNLNSFNFLNNPFLEGFEGNFLETFFETVVFDRFLNER